MTNKTSTALASLVAAVPAAVLAVLLGMTFLGKLQELQSQGTMFMVLYAGTLLMCAVVIFLPLGVLIFGPKSQRAPKPAPKSGDAIKKKPAKSGEELAVVEPTPSSEALEAHEMPSSGGGSTGELQVVEASPSMDDLSAIDEEPAFSDEFASVEDSFKFDDEEPEPPKKKKKK